MLGKTLHSVPLCSLHFLSKPDMVWEGRRWKNQSCFNSQANLLPLTHQTQLNVKWYQLCIFPVEVLFGKPLKIRSLDKSTNPSRIICLSVAAGVSRGALQVGATSQDGRVASHEGLKPGRQTHHPHLDSSWNKAFPRAIHILIEVGGSQPGFQARFSPPILNMPILKNQINYVKQKNDICPLWPHWKEGQRPPSPQVHLWGALE